MIDSTTIAAEWFLDKYQSKVHDLAHAQRTQSPITQFTFGCEMVNTYQKSPQTEFQSNLLNVFDLLTKKYLLNKNNFISHRNEYSRHNTMYLWPQIP
ncbi:hypothetical protein evm_012221 [Chilo suppressalis]|nr:hypothetical protein evm_012221 [Chilo suppressalis]